MAVDDVPAAKIVLAQHRDIVDPDTGGSFTVKAYESEKVIDDGEVRGSIALRPLNPAYKPIVLTNIDEDEVAVIAELVDVLPPGRDESERLT